MGDWVVVVENEIKGGERSFEGKMWGKGFGEC